MLPICQCSRRCDTKQCRKCRKSGVMSSIATNDKFKTVKIVITKCRMEGLVYVYILARYKLQVPIVKNHSKGYNNLVFGIIC